MNANAASRGMKSMVQRLLLVVVVLAVFFGTTPANKAHAWTTVIASGRPGSLGLPYIYVGDLLMPSGLTQFTLYGNTGPIAYRSPASTGTQVIYAQYFVDTWDGSKWVTSVQTGLFSGIITAGQSSVQFPAPYIQPLMARGTFRVSYSFIWKSGGGTILATSSIGSNVSTDHICVTKIRLCRSYPGYFITGLNNSTW